MTIILKPFAILLLWLINFCQSYGLGLILFTLIIKVILFPFNLKSKRSMIKTTALQAQVQRLQKQYAKNPDKMNQAISELYQKENVSPMSGCIWMLIPFILLIALYSIIRQPLTYMMSLDAAQIESIRGALSTLGVTIQDGAYMQLQIADALSAHLGEVQAALPDLAGNLFSMNFQFLGVNLAAVPNFRFWEAGSFTWGYIGLFLVPIVSAITGFFSSWYSMKVNAMQNPEQANTGMNKMMLLYMPVISIFIGFAMPAGLGIYWIASNIFTLLSEMVFKVLLKSEYEKAAIERAEREKREKEEEARRKEEERAERARRIEEEKLARKNHAKRKAEKQQKKSDSGSIAASAVGIRAYARGRAYDPTRFSPDGPTPYRDPSAVVDEEAIERAVEEKEIQAEVEAAMQRDKEANAAVEQSAPEQSEASAAEFPKTMFDEAENDSEDEA
ncbi:MAG: membrane protein insertase YidC [Oscillospiraceae bacterium]|nr:membrane protein insertase YidC [Oscillospiraceae bacterium]